MQSFKRIATVGIVATIVSVLAGCGPASSGTSVETTSASNSATLQTDNTATTNETSFEGNTKNSVANSTAPLEANNTNIATGTNATSQTTSNKTGAATHQPSTPSHPDAFVFYVKCQPNQTYTLFGAGPGGASAPLGEIKTGAMGWVETPLTPSNGTKVKPGWIYQFGAVGFAYLTQGPQLAITPSTSYTVRGHAAGGSQTDVTLKTGTTARNGYIAIPDKPGWNITIRYLLNGVTHSVQIRVPAQG